MGSFLNGVLISGTETRSQRLNARLGCLNTNVVPKLRQ
jgi:hypothetical protein